MLVSQATGMRRENGARNRGAVGASRCFSLVFMRMAVAVVDSVSVVVVFRQRRGR